MFDPALDRASETVQVHFLWLKTSAQNQALFRNNLRDRRWREERGTCRNKERGGGGDGLLQPWGDSAWSYKTKQKLFITSSSTPQKLKYWAWKRTVSFFPRTLVIIKSSQRHILSVHFLFLYFNLTHCRPFALFLGLLNGTNRLILKIIWAVKG